MRNLVAISVSILFIASSCIANARADATSDVLAAAKSFGAQKSAHAVITSSNGQTFAIDMVEPNKMRGTTPEGIRFVMIGNDTWVNMGGGWQSYTVGGKAVQTEMQMARGSQLQRSILSECTITDKGMSTANG
ncbi:MAG TPA: hypothetical protein VFE36_05525, partial [Candidatus Baltobacteraceae bacterium]|nr:hypothetical protein [Candidatus Baltobacteraceae bacterium]